MRNLHAVTVAAGAEAARHEDVWLGGSAATPGGSVWWRDPAPKTEAPLPRDAQRPTIWCGRCAPKCASPNRGSANGRSHATELRTGPAACRVVDSELTRLTACSIEIEISVARMRGTKHKSIDSFSFLAGPWMIFWPSGVPVRHLHRPGGVGISRTRSAATSRMRRMALMLPGRWRVGGRQTPCCGNWATRQGSSSRV